MSSTGYDCALNMIDLGIFSLEKSLSQVFCRTKLHKNGYRKNFIFTQERNLDFEENFTEQYLTYY